MCIEPKLCFNSVLFAYLWLHNAELVLQKEVLAYFRLCGQVELGGDGLKVYFAWGFFGLEKSRGSWEERTYFNMVEDIVNF